MMRKGIAVLLIILLTCLGGCVSPTSGLLPYSDARDGYRFLYPNGWVQKSVQGGADVLFHDIIQPLENVSVVIGELKSVQKLGDLGSPQAVGERVRDRIIAPPESNRKAELISATSQTVNGKEYYLLEYAIDAGNGRQRHDLVAVTANNRRLYTLDISAPENRWAKVKDMFEQVVRSFQVE
ncbi:MAG: photosystem II reaction center PsbP [Pseudanabaenaceae cyanobacterium SKYGB_i_bin29]|nr:photosystem II reaction center PsbP [Pseudanabaenaceae cyanobacterium SKYG29]MDW8421993.1 photosystem II reaction center PsbP [Pseudanabaenaceae cyanobacterium SKYGB_i_bin29]